MQFVRGRELPTTRIFGATKLQGFTLVELLVTIAVAAILLAIATPSFTSMLNSNRLTSAANEMVATLQAARMEAVRQNRSITVCSSAGGSACGGSGSWIVLDSDDNVVRVSTFDPSVEASAGVAQFQFRPDGLARNAAGGLLASDFTFCIPTTSPPENLRIVSVGSGSRISSQRDDGGGECP